MNKTKKDSFDSLAAISVNGIDYQYHSLAKFSANSGIDISRLPYCVKILLENLLRREDGLAVTRDDIEALANWDPAAAPEREIQFMPSRTLLQDFTGVPVVADLASMRQALKKLGGDPSRINPLQPVDLVIDHSVQVDKYGSVTAFAANAEIEFERNRERYLFLRWGQQGFDNFTVAPPATGICHQVNLEFLSKVAMTSEADGRKWVYPDTLVGTDSHTTMINGMGVLGWGVGGIEAEAAMLGQPISLLIPRVVGFRLEGKLPPGGAATDLALTVTQMLRERGVVDKFVEFFGPGLENMAVADRATISNMSPENGATTSIFPVDEQVSTYLSLTGREELIPLVEAYFREQGLWRGPGTPEARYSDTLELSLDSVEPSISGPSRPQDRIALKDAKAAFRKSLVSLIKDGNHDLDKHALERWSEEGGSCSNIAPELQERHPDARMGAVGVCVPVRQPDGETYNLCHGSIIIAAITSCTNTSNPSVLIAAGLLARNAVKRGLSVKPWVKTSFAPGSKVVTDYLDEAGLTPYMEALKFHLVGYGCTTCIGNSGPLPAHIIEAIAANDLTSVSVLSGNRNFEGRINAYSRANYLASPPLVIAYALAGNINMNLTKDPVGIDPNGEPVYLSDIWPSDDEAARLVEKHVTARHFTRGYSDVYGGNDVWNNLEIPAGGLYEWDEKSTYLKNPPFFDGITAEPEKIGDIKNARVLALLGDTVTTDHISPAGSIPEDGPAGKYLVENGVKPADFNSFGSRRGNHEVMARGAFANIRLKNLLVPGTEGGVTAHLSDKGEERMTIYDAAMRYQDEGTPLVVVAGREYGTGSSRDWAAKGALLLGVKAIIAESFERIHRSNLIGMGVLPLQFKNGQNRETLGITGKETFDIAGLDNVQPASKINVIAHSSDGKTIEFEALARIDTPIEAEYYRHGGVLPYVLRQTLAEQ